MMEINQILASYLAKILGETTSFKFIAHGFHWNVKGVGFPYFHSFFEEIYTDANDAIDGVAENIRKLNYDAPFLLQDLVNLSSEMQQPSMTETSDSASMCISLYQRNEQVRKCLLMGILLAEQAEQQGILNFLAERFDQHSKWQWQLRSIIGDSLSDSYEINVQEITDSFLVEPPL
jgi:starvation-inducible DNA-binding protein